MAIICSRSPQAAIYASRMTPIFLLPLFSCACRACTFISPSICHFHRTPTLWPFEPFFSVESTLSANPKVKHPFWDYISAGLALAAATMQAAVGFIAFPLVHGRASGQTFSFGRRIWHPSVRPVTEFPCCFLRMNCVFPKPQYFSMMQRYNAAPSGTVTGHFILTNGLLRKSSDIFRFT